MSETTARRLTGEEIRTMTDQGCRCADWSAVLVSDDFDARRVRNAKLSGEIRLGGNSGSFTTASGVEKPCGIEDATLHNCTIGNGVRIARVAGHVANYRIDDGAWIEDVGVMETRPGARFGNGLQVEALNEGGGRAIVMFNRLNSQFAYLACLHRYRPAVVERLRQIALAEAEKIKSDTGIVGAGAKVFQVKTIVDVNVGQHALIDGASLLTNGSVLSSREAPTEIGGDVHAEDFIVAEGSRVGGGVVLAKSYIGQGCRLGKQFSCEGSLFFANGEGFHGEACSVFAGPYTVTHHKSTLLIAGLFSFYNAGSGTNQSNHLYKLGPLHEGKLERGCKTGSFSYMKWPCRVGPFSVVLGKHNGGFDTGDFPFSYLEASPAGRCSLTPGMNITTVGTVRDGAKWPARDRRRGPVKRDRISFAVFSPLTAGRMLAGMARMKVLQESTDRKIETVVLGGADVKRVLLGTCQKFYRSALQRYLLGRVFERAEAAVRNGADPVAAMAPAPTAAFSEEWLDVGGLLLPKARLESLCAAVQSGAIATIDAWEAALDAIQAAYGEDEWAWVRWAYPRVFEKELAEIAPAGLAEAADAYLAAQGKFLRMVTADAAKEFEGPIRLGFGQDGRAEDRDADFTAVRGQAENDPFVRQLNGEIAALEERVANFKKQVAG